MSLNEQLPLHNALVMPLHNALVTTMGQRLLMVMNVTSSVRGVANWMG